VADLCALVLLQLIADVTVFNWSLTNFTLDYLWNAKGVNFSNAALVVPGHTYAIIHSGMCILSRVLLRRRNAGGWRRRRRLTRSLACYAIDLQNLASSLEWSPPARSSS